MKAVEFIKKHGWEESQFTSQIIKETGENIHGVNRDDLYDLVDSWELTQEFGNDVSFLKKYLLKNPKVKGFYIDSWCQTFSRERLEQAIADVESVELS